MSVSITFRALSQWPLKPTPASSRKRSQFQSTWSKTVDLLERELGLLGAKNVVIEADCEPSEVRIDGNLRANAKLRGPGVVVSFDCSKGAMRFPCDTFTDWQANVRGIALALEALRAVDRYGVTQQAEQYRGWTALPDLRDHTYGARRHAAEDIVQMVLGCPVFPPKQSPTVQQLLDDPEERRRVQRQLMVAFHPDRQGGNDESFLEMNRLFSILNGRDD